MRIFFCMASHVRTASGSDRIYHPTFDRAALRRFFFNDSSDPVATARGSDTRFDPAIAKAHHPAPSPKRRKEKTYAAWNCLGPSDPVATARGSDTRFDLAIAKAHHPRALPKGEG